MNKAFFFGDGSTQEATLFGISTIPDRIDPAGLGILFCHAFGEERQKSYRSTFLFAQELAAEGIPSLRFDYRGTGDSHGELQDITLRSMIADTVRAYDQARQELGVQRIAILGIRLGAVMAVGASRLISDLETLVLWNPIVNGASYFRELNRTEMIIRLGYKKSGNENPSHAQGFVELGAEFVSPAMIEQFKRIDLSTDPISVKRCLVAGREDDAKERGQIEEFVEHARREGVDTTSWVGEERDYWSSDSMYDAFHPRKCFATTRSYLSRLAG